jgi:hypothetical protein
MSFSQAKFEISFLEKRLLHLQSLSSPSHEPPFFPLPVSSPPPLIQSIPSPEISHPSHIRSSASNLPPSHFLSSTIPQPSSGSASPSLAPLALEIVRKCLILGQSQIRAKNFSKAAAILSKARHYSDPSRFSFEGLPDWQMNRVKVLAGLGKSLQKLGKWEEAELLLTKLDRHLKVGKLLRQKNIGDLVRCLEIVWGGLAKDAYRRGDAAKIEEFRRKLEEVIDLLEEPGEEGGKKKITQNLDRVYFKCEFYAAMLDDKESLYRNLNSLYVFASKKLPENDKFILKLFRFIKKTDPNPPLKRPSPLKISPTLSPRRSPSPTIIPLQPAKKHINLQKFEQFSTLPPPQYSSSLQFALPSSANLLLSSTTGIMFSKRPPIPQFPINCPAISQGARGGRSPKNSLMNSSIRQPSLLDSEMMEKSIHLSLRRNNERNSLQNVFRLDEEEEGEESVLEEEDRETAEEKSRKEEEEKAATKLQNFWRKMKKKEKKIGIELEQDRLLTYKMSARASMLNFNIERKEDLEDVQVVIRSPIREVFNEDLENLQFEEIKIPGGLIIRGIELKFVQEGEEEKMDWDKEKEKEDSVEKKSCFAYKLHLQEGRERFDLIGKVRGCFVTHDKCSFIWFLVNRILEQKFGEDEMQPQENAKKEYEPYDEEEALQIFASVTDEKEVFSFLNRIFFINKGLFYRKNRLIGPTKRLAPIQAENFYRNRIIEAKNDFILSRRLLIRTIATFS